MFITKISYDYCDISGFYSMSGFIAFVTVATEFTNILQTGASLRFRHLLSNTHLTLILMYVC